ncbi:hypothetical protein [Actinomadura rifamycini]|uniref:hypothetical protein n=1 Tax=Actinomadura rifamycini TaxID=31962 RepID=UPI0012F82FBE|nr:hypothetical protein [Actinomadura rifamycini]
MCAVLGITGCSGGDDPEPSAGSGQTASAGSGQGGQEAAEAAGDDQASITGTWRGPKNGADNETFEFRGDGTVSLSSDGETCDGTVEPKGGERTYAFQIDCGGGPFPGTAVVSPDGATVTLTDPDGEKSDYGRVPD